MCRFKSFVATKKRLLAYVGVDSHEDILDLSGLNDNTIDPDFVRLELHPNEYTIEEFRNVDKWVFNVDQDNRPDWFILEEWDKRCRDWMKKNIYNDISFISDQVEVVLGIVNRVIGSGSISILLGSVGRLRENSSVGELRENSSVGELWENSSVGELMGNSKVRRLRDNSSVGELWDNSSVGELRENSSVGELWNNSSVGELRDNSSVGKLWDNSSVGKLWDNSSIGELWDNSSVGELRGNSSAGKLMGNSKVGKLMRNSKVISDNRLKK